MRRIEKGLADAPCNLGSNPASSKSMKGTSYKQNQNEEKHHALDINIRTCSCSLGKKGNLTAGKQSNQLGSLMCIPCEKRNNDAVFLQIYSAKELEKNVNTSM